jgi:hypothetical protein
MVVLSLANSAVIISLIRTANGPNETPQGLPIGASLPSFEITNLAGARTTESEVAGRLLLFLGASCRPCHGVARELAGAKASLVQRLSILVIGDVPAEGDDLLDILRFMPANRVAHDPGHVVAERLAVFGTPFAYAIDRSGNVQAKTVASSIAHLRELEGRAGR